MKEETREYANKLARRLGRAINCVNKNGCVIGLPVGHHITITDESVTYLNDTEIICAFDYHPDVKDVCKTVTMSGFPARPKSTISGAISDVIITVGVVVTGYLMVKLLFF